MVQVAIPIRAVGFRKNKKEVYFTYMGIGEQTPLNRLLSFFAHRVTSPTLSMVQTLISIGQGVKVWRGSKNCR
jgi:hypothetical protein